MRFFTSAVSAILALQAGLAYACTKTISGTILIIARDNADAANVAAGFKAYGIKTENLIVPNGGTALPVLNSTIDRGNYGGIVTHAELSYENGGNFASALTTEQWNALYQYQVDFGVRMARIDAYPTTEFGTEAVFSTADEQQVYFTDTSEFATANVKTNAGVSTLGLYHTGGKIVDATIAKAIAEYDASAGKAVSVAAVVNKYPTGRQQLVWFTSWASDWSLNTNFLQHSVVHFVTRGLFAGKRKTYLNTQVDDVHLSTEIYYPAGQPEFRLRPADLTNIKNWQAGLQSRLPAGSNFFIELAHNGNGAIIAATNGGEGSGGVCKPDVPVDYDEIPNVAYEWRKPLGTGIDMWPPSFTTTYPWDATCPKLDSLLQWFQVESNRNAFAHLSHTFTHEEMNNATYNDANREMIYNIKWLKDVGFWTAQRFSESGLVPPAITGLHNGDVIRAWMENGIKYVVGDNTRPALLNTQSVYWPLITTFETNGHDGLVIVPRFATTIYYNCDTPECTTKEWTDTSTATGDFNALLADAKMTNTRYLLALRADPYMFHQANLRQSDMPTITIGNQSGQFSLIQMWIELITQELTRLTNWPIQTLKHDDIAHYFLDRVTLDGCEANVEYIFDHDNKKITGVNLVANGNTCGVEVPLTVPGPVTTSSGGVVQDTVGSEPTIAWATLNGSPISFALSTPIAV
ncbi:hypothetical protein jhhlp_007745 [Lomentospora prolificans]|uniref:Extracellular serine-rich protein n=1 Tax=Lomentospora prolificans TaxID=41688 RepID=A0A2N3N0F7_9PEZI|nr:hypothetical protein jhhlp_007745 [Lomentospora prolificans]